MTQQQVGSEALSQHYSNAVLAQPWLRLFVPPFVFPPRCGTYRIIINPPQ